MLLANVKCLVLIPSPANFLLHSLSRKDVASVYLRATNVLRKQASICLIILVHDRNFLTISVLRKNPGHTYLSLYLALWK